MLQKFLLLSLFFLLSACANTSAPINNDRTFMLNTTVVSKSPLPKEYFIKNYQKETIPLYKEEQLQELQSTVNADISTVKQFQKSDVLNLFGTPVLIKSEGVAEVWQYKTTTCILNFVWVGENPIVNTIKSYNNQQDDFDSNTCVRDKLSHALELEAVSSPKKKYPY